MKKLFWVFISIGILFISCQTTSNKEQPNRTSEHLVLATDWFQKSAEMRACFYQAYNLAELRLKEHLKNYRGEKPTAVVLDIDETVLDNSPYEGFLIKTGEAYSGETWKKWTATASAKALPGALEFTNAAKDLGVNVIYISNRKEDELKPTLKNLSDLGFPDADTNFVFLRKLGESSDKTSRREMVMKKYEVLLYIGDNLTDFRQMYGGRDSTLGFDRVNQNKETWGNRFIILPNPMYGEWEGAIYGNNYAMPTDKKSNLRRSVLEKFTE